MYKKDFNRLMKLSEAGVSDAVIIHSILEICSNYPTDPGLNTAAHHIQEFMAQKGDSLTAVNTACSILQKVATLYELSGLEPDSPENDMLEEIQHFLNIWQHPKP